MKNLYNHIAAAILFTFCSVSMASAEGLTSYFMPNAIGSMEHNAAFAPSRGYFNVPVVGAMSLGMNGNLSIGDFLVPSDGSLVTIFDTSISSQAALSGLKSQNNLGLDGRIGILGFGRYCKDQTSFWSFDLNMRTVSSFSLPYELFEFFKEAPEECSIKDVNFYIDSYIEAAFGYSKQLDKRLTVGGRVKFLAGLMNTDLNIESMDVTMNYSEWHVEANGSFDLNAKGMGAESHTNSDGVETYELGDVEGDITGVSGYGVAVDFGATYDYSDRLRFSFAVNDLGFIVWGRGGNTSAKVMDNFNFVGVEYDVSNDESSDNGDFTLDDIVMEAQSSSASTNWLQSNVNGGAEYDFLDHRLGVGMVYSIDFWRYKTIHSLATIATFTPIDWFTVAASYTVSGGGANSFGLAANFATKFINLYVASDIVTAKVSSQFIPIEQSMMNVSFGIAVPLGARGQRL